MGSGRRAASKTGKKSRRNEGLARVPAIFGPNNPAQAAVVRLLAQHKPAPGQCEILRPARFTAIRKLAQSLHRGIQTLLAWRIAATRHELDDAAQQACPKIGRELGEARAVDGDHALLVDLQ